MKRLLCCSGRSKTIPRLFPVLVLAALVFSMAPTFLPAATGAQDGEEPTPVTEMQDDGGAGGDGQEGEDAAPTETVESESAEPSETPSVESEIPPGGVAAYIAEARGCPAGFDPSGGDASAALANCVQPLAGIAFTLGTQDPAYPGDTRTTGGDGVAVWTDIPLGAGYSVSTALPQESGDPWVYCELTGGAASDQYLFFPAGGGYMDVGLSDQSQAGYAQTYCRWFTAASTSAGLAGTPDANQALGAGEVQLTNYLCPVNYDTADMTLPSLQAACTTPGAGFQFTLKPSSGSPRSGATDAQGLLRWTGVPSGKLTINESIPAGYRYAQPYCSVSPVGAGPGTPDLSLVQSDGKTITGKLLAGQALHCALFNIAVPESTIAMLPFLCPSNYDTANMTLQALTAGCSTAGTNISYTLTTPDGVAQAGATGSNGFIEFTRIPSGSFSIEETVPAGYLLGAVYCDPAPPQGELDGTGWQMPAVENNVISANVPDRYTLNCFVFHIWPPAQAPAGAGGYTVYLNTYLCPPGLTFDDTTSLADNSTRCHGAAGWSYQYAGDGFSQQLVTDPIGATTASHAPAGPFTLTGAGHEGSRPEALWCSSNGGDFKRMASRDELTFAYTPAADEVLNCQWFNVSSYPDGTFVTLSIDTRLCGPVYPATVVVEDWRTSCPNPQPGLTFEVQQSDGAIVTGTSDQAGLVTLKVAPGDLNIVEAQPDAYPGGYAWCGTQQGGGQPTYVNAGRLSPGDPNMPLSNVNPDYTYVCQWFNAPLGSPAKATGDGGEVTILKWRCPAGYDPAGATLDQLRADCPTPQPGVQIGVFYASGDSFTAPTRLEKGPAIARFEDLPAGKVGIGETGPSGQELGRVFCETRNAGSNEQMLTDGYAEYTVADGGIAVTIEGGKAIECQFFNVPTDDTDTPPMAGTVVINMRSCPPGFAAIPASYVNIAMYCAAEPGVDVKVTRGETGLSAVTGENGLATFTKVAAGALRITALPREGYDPPRVLCRATAEGAGATGELTPVAVENWGIAYDLRDGDYLECVWANMPAAGNTTDPGVVTLHAYTCPQGTGEDASLPELLTTCTGRPEGVAFTAGPPLQPPAEAATGPSGDVSFAKVAPGFNSIEQVAGQGSRPLAAWCAYFPTATGSPLDASGHTARPLYAFMSAGYTLECYWFAVPYVEPVTVTVLERLCPADYGTVGASREDLLFNCTDTPEDVEFRVRDVAGTYDATQVTDAAGSAIFAEVPVKPIDISENSPVHEAVAVYCGQGAAGELPTTYSELDVTDESVRYEIQPGADVLCYWVAVEAPPATVTIHKYACPEGYEPQQASYDAVEAKCATPLKGVTFTLGGPATELSQKTDASGVVTWDGIWPGPLVITETPPAGTTGALVFCAIRPNGGTQEAFEQVPVEQFTIERTVDGGDALECFWFDLSHKTNPDQPAQTPTPAPTKTPTATATPVVRTATPDPDAPATLILTMRSCPADFDLHDPETDLAKECDQPAEDIEFSLDALDDDASPAGAEASTDDDGVAIFAGVDPGPWLLTGSLPEETQTAFIGTCSSDQRDVQADGLFRPLTYIGPDGQIGVTLLGGETLSCDVYTIPEEREAA